VSNLRFSSRIRLVEADGTPTREFARFLSTQQLFVSGENGSNKVEEAKVEAVTAKTDAASAQTTADTVTATVFDPTTGLVAVSTVASDAKFTAELVEVAVSDPSTGLAATKTVADTAVATASSIDSKLTGLTAIVGTYSATASGAYGQSQIQALMDEVSALRSALVTLYTELSA